ncbi:MAG: TIGR01212 family radical SAM protein [Ruminococcus sp.]|uniref:TIGR01212 family radical SAM protein n=1 Tax=Ruminococcus sp. TaxID=41978 RepID=UPI0025DFE16A|nr:TIGR01212 family radical SAM protein [Ruminococcus sp.]MCR4795300.1 TIGR01212 family radical SAM protein [Ruminococcus sp.]
MNKSPFIYSCDNKRYYTLNYYNKNKFGPKIYKAVIDCDFTCPNIDGTKGVGGCIFCDGGSGYFTHSGLTVKEQLEAEHRRIAKKYGDSAEFIAYFQANTNTYAPLSVLKECYYSAIGFPNVCGLSIGTRADCLSEEVVDLLYSLSLQTNLTVELGMQSCHDDTLKLINRCCTHEEFLRGYYKLKSKGIRVCLHIINGLPFETSEMMLETAVEAAKMEPDAVKLQMLHVIRGTRLEKMYRNGEFQLLSRDEYINIIVKQLEVLPAHTVIERITGDGDKSKLIAPMWSADKIAVLGGIDKKLAELDTWQSRLFYKK